MASTLFGLKGPTYKTKATVSANMVDPKDKTTVIGTFSTIADVTQQDSRYGARRALDEIGATDDCYSLRNYLESIGALNNDLALFDGAITPSNSDIDNKYTPKDSPVNTKVLIKKYIKLMRCASKALALYETQYAENIENGMTLQKAHSNAMHIAKASYDSATNNIKVAIPKDAENYPRTG